MRKVVIGLIIALAVLVVLVGGFLVYPLLNKHQKNDLANPFAGSGQGNLVSINDIVISETHIAYLLNEIGAYKLQNSPVYGKPVINVVVDAEDYKSEIDNGKINVQKSSFDSPDIIISTTKLEVVNAITSSEIKEYVKSSVSSGKTTVEMKAGYPGLYSKNYLTLYEEMTGKKLF